MLACAGDSQNFHSFYLVWYCKSCVMIKIYRITKVNCTEEYGCLETFFRRTAFYRHKPTRKTKISLFVHFPFFYDMKTFPLYTVYISITIPMVWEFLHIQMQKEWPFWSRGPPKSLQLHGPLHTGMTSASQLAAGFSVLCKTVIHSSLLQLHIRNSSDIGSQRFTLVINSLLTPMPSSHFKQSLKIKTKGKHSILYSFYKALMTFLCSTLLQSGVNLQPFFHFLPIMPPNFATWFDFSLPCFIYPSNPIVSQYLCFPSCWNLTSPQIPAVLVNAGAEQWQLSLLNQIFSLCSLNTQKSD